jgi:hypothetical protein
VFGLSRAADTASPAFPRAYGPLHAKRLLSVHPERSVLGPCDPGNLGCLERGEKRPVKPPDPRSVHHPDCEHDAIPRGTKQGSCVEHWVCCQDQAGPSVSGYRLMAASPSPDPVSPNTSILVDLLVSALSLVRHQHHCQMVCSASQFPWLKLVAAPPCPGS